ncbi:MAG: trypsin-like serine protease [Spirochaetaceae bacterium]|nr:trypsin-like serine protease [Spirochaetaceae bacterium]
MKREFTAKLVMLAAVCALGAFCDRAAALTNAEAMPPEAFRFVAYVGDDYGYCTGAIIAPTWVLTAAHCVVHGDGSTIKPDEIGDLSRGWPDDDWERVPVKRVISHPHYYWEGDGFRNDVALLELARPFASAELVAVLGPEDETLHAPNGTTAVLIGYGENEHGQRDRDGLFRVLEAPLYHADACRTEHSFVDPRDEIVHDLTICAGDRARGIRSGDSGGPLLVETEDGTYGVIGVASISGNDPTGYPVVAVYTRVATVKEWIDGCVHGTEECVEGGVSLPELKRYGPNEIRNSETLESRPTAVIFVNETQGVISHHWIAFDGGEIPYGSVAPGESYSQHTYPGHVWAVKDAEGRTFGVFVAEREMGRAIVTGEAVMAAVQDDSGGAPVAVAAPPGGGAWTKLEQDFPCPDPCVGSWRDGEFHAEFNPSVDLDRQTTPGTWGGYPQGTMNRPSPWDGIWAVYEAADGAVVQVAAFGDEVSERHESGTGWRLWTGSSWGEWNIEHEPLRTDGGSRLPRHVDVQAAPASPVSLIQGSQLGVAVPPGEQYNNGRNWLSSWLLLIHDEATGAQTAVQCWYGCRAYQRGSDLAVVAAADPELPALHDGGAAVPTQPVALLPGLSREKIAQVLDEALSATMWNMHGEEVPDWGARLRAVELAIALWPAR